MIQNQEYCRTGGIQFYPGADVTLENCTIKDNISYGKADDPDNPDAVTKFDFNTDMESVFESKLDPTIMDCIRRKKNRVFGVDEFVNITVFADDVAVYDKGHLDISDGHTLIIKNRRTEPIYRMVVSVGPTYPEYKLNQNRVWITCITTRKKV